MADSNIGFHQQYRRTGKMPKVSGADESTSAPGGYKRGGRTKGVGKMPHLAKGGALGGIKHCGTDNF